MKRFVRAPFAVVAAGVMVSGSVPSVVAHATPARTPVLSAAPAATGDLPPGWQAERSGTRLVWTAARPLPMGGARVEVRADGRLLGYPLTSPDRRRITLDLPLSTGPGAPKSLSEAGRGTPGAPGIPGNAERPVGDLSSLQVVAAGRRLDAAAPAAAREAPASTPPSAATATLPADADPGVPGPYQVREDEYELSDREVPSLPEPVEMQAAVISPVGADGARPVALFLHGRHVTCFRGGEVAGVWPCPEGWDSIPSYRGYLHTQRLLASQGWITVSIGVNGVNGQDDSLADGGAGARSEIVRAHLARWAEWAGSDQAWNGAPAAVRSGPRPDLDQVLLVGHSRGGEGVNRAALDSASDANAGWRVRGQVLLGPTAFGQNPVPGIPTTVVLPYCDGDVSDLQGQAYLDQARDVTDDPALRSSVMVLGANHNYFNTEWTPGESVAPSSDDYSGSDEVCGAQADTRLDAAEQRAVGNTYVAATAQVLVGKDAAVLPLLDGSGARAESAGDAQVLTHALGARRSPLLVPDADTSAQGVDGVSATVCRTDPLVGESPAAGSSAPCAPDVAPDAVPHFLANPLGLPDGPTRQAVSIDWQRSGGAVDLPLPGPRSLVDADDLALRVAVPPGSPELRLDVQVSDGAGRTATVDSVATGGLPATGTGSDAAQPGKYWAQELRADIDDAALDQAGIDRADIRALRLVPRSDAGQLWLLDSWSRRSGLAPDAPVSYARLDVGTVTVEEGDSGSRQVDVPITLSGPVDQPSSFWIGVGVPEGSRLVTVPAGERRVAVPITVNDDQVDDLDVSVTAVGVDPVRGAAAGEWIGGLRVQDNDPSPALTVAPQATASEGGTLRWELTLAGPSDRTVEALVVARPAEGGATELSSDDVDQDWLADQGFEPPQPAVPLSELGLVLFGSVQPGETTGSVEVPLRSDDVQEGIEALSMRIPAKDEPIPGYEEFGPYPGVPGLPQGADLTGTVTDAPS
ncbi:MAG: hypothetical protein ACRCY8_15700 [Dermatophilaceae bacterium]